MASVEVAYASVKKEAARLYILVATTSVDGASTSIGDKLFMKPNKYRKKNQQMSLRDFIRGSVGHKVYSLRNDPAYEGFLLPIGGISEVVGGKP